MSKVFAELFEGKRKCTIKKYFLCRNMADLRDFVRDSHSHFATFIPKPFL